MRGLYIFFLLIMQFFPSTIQEMEKSFIYISVVLRNLIACDYRETGPNESDSSWQHYALCFSHFNDIYTALMPKTWSFFLNS